VAAALFDAGGGDLAGFVDDEQDVDLALQPLGDGLCRVELAGGVEFFQVFPHRLGPGFGSLCGGFRFGSGLGRLFGGVGLEGFAGGRLGLFGQGQRWRCGGDRGRAQFGDHGCYGRRLFLAKIEIRQEGQQVQGE
jgi:hypothetical protein